MAAKPPPTWMIRLNMAMLRRGMRIGSQWLLTAPGRRNGEPRSTPVSLAVVDSRRYIVAAFSGASWVLNVQAARQGTLSRGRQSEQVNLSEVASSERGPVLRAFLEQVRGGRRFFGGQTPDEVVAHADRYPIFRVDPG